MSRIRRKLLIIPLLFTMAVYVVLYKRTSPAEVRQPPLPFEVDLVITYVNGSDRLWRRAFLDELHSATKDGDLLPFAASESRFHDHDDLRFLLRSVDTYGENFFRRIFLVVAFESQIPCWLRNNTRLKIVFHRDIFYNSSDLPTFNSLAIEANLHHIAGLADHYIYVNDDFAFLSPIQIEDYAEIDERGDVRSIIVRQNPKISIDEEAQPLNGSSPDANYLNGAIHTKDVMLALLNDGACAGRSDQRVRDVLRNVPSHTPKFFIRSILVDAESNERVLTSFETAWSQKFRSGAEIDLGHFFGAFAECTSGVDVQVLMFDNLLYIRLDEALRSVEALRDELLPLVMFRFQQSLKFDSPVGAPWTDEFLRILRFQFLCVNDVTNGEPTEFGLSLVESVRNFREQLFPVASSFEFD